MTTCTLSDPILTGLDLEPILVKLMDQEDGPGWTLEHTRCVETEYRRFLLLCKLKPDQTIVPSKAVDAMWHNHILDTAKYREDCAQFCGGFLDHFPYLGMRGDDDRRAWQEAGRDTIALYESIFGEPAGEIWVGAGKCNPSCGPCGNPSHGPCGQPSRCNGIGQMERPRLVA